MDRPIIEVNKLVKRFGDFTAVDGLDLAIREGTCVGLLGPNGAGKTTTIEILEGLQQPTSGEVRLFQKTWAEDSDFLRDNIGIQLQESAYLNQMSVEEMITLFKSFYKTSKSVNAAITLVRLDEKRKSHVYHLSGGQRQRLGLALALIAEPKIVFLDEPTTGLDPQARRVLWDIIETLKKEGKTILLTTHSMEEAEILCDRVVIVDHGKIVADGSPAQLIATLGGDELIEVVSDPALPEAALAALPGCSRVIPQAEGVHLSVKELKVTLPALVDLARAHGATLHRLQTRRVTLDDVFLKITGRSLREDA